MIAIDVESNCLPIVPMVTINNSHKHSCRPSGRKLHTGYTGIRICFSNGCKKFFARQSIFLVDTEP